MNADTIQLLTYAQVSERTGIKMQTLYNWRASGKLNPRTGLMLVGRTAETPRGTPRINWPLFASTLLGAE